MQQLQLIGSSAVKKTVVETSEALTAWPEYPAAIRGGGFVFLSGVRGGRASFSPAAYAEIPAKGFAKPQGYPLVDGGEEAVAVDAWTAHQNMEMILAAAGTRSDQLVRQHMWQRDKRFYPSYEGVRKFWQPVASPSSGLGVSRVTGRYGRWIGIDSMAIDIADADNLGAREVLAAPDYAKLPSASIYSQAVASGPLVFLAGHIPIRTAAPGKPVVAGFDDLPPEGRFLETGRSHPDSRDGPIAAQTWFVYNEIFRNLADHGLGPADVVHLNVYLSDLRDLATFHRVHLHFFGADGPAICVTGFDEVGHKGCRIEIEPTALRRSEKLTPSQIPWPCRPPMSGPAAVCAGPLLFISGMLGLTDDGHIAKGAETVEPASRDFVRSLEAKGGTPGVAVQSWMAWHRLRQVCETAGVPLSALAKTIVYLKDEADLGIYEAVRASFISENLPAFDCTVIHGPGPVPDAVVQIDAIGLLT